MLLEESPRLVVKKVLAKCLQESDGAILKGFSGRYTIYTTLLFLHSKFSFFNFYFVHICICWDHARDTDDCWLFDVGYSLVTLNRELDCDPFVLLIHFSVTSPGGFPDHPHRGFEAFTYVLEGAIRYEDFGGHKGTLRAGDVQWMRAGRGTVHSEMPAEEGTHTGLQLWINLPSQHKMIEPGCKDVGRKEIAMVEREGAEIKVLAGEAFGVKTPVHSKTPIVFLDVTMKPNSKVHLATPEREWNYLVYVMEGEAVVGSEASWEAVAAEEAAVMSGGEEVRVWNKSEKKRVKMVMVGGEAVNEEVVHKGPFVMNNESEIEEAVKDFGLFENGFEMAKSWKSNSNN